ncbi:phosphatidylglycerol lysyltransferase domain-containing protein [Sphingobacterium sp. SRCM116780]|uniref:phosphatidylglycerol lysyltransferase domain-containing protein n=1 Tax=Sphingobacterium sp. SRCM116780 TaxID=2907623 RepID=UPI001F366F33|nr:phosphatidylglycerol lysyltransferase domain-containing protein [Sphingobacterium sp. SRCM116780]UIR55615.1 phosphatidylglycerol lysyltransferase domain-containing protein [Sphingobacterium sp. SRCM116780]
MKDALLRGIRKLSPKTYWKEMLAIFIVLLAFVFFRSERKEITSIGPQLASADFNWLLIGLSITIIYILLQGVMYIYSFRSIGLRLNLWDAVELFLKRNLLSVFLPAGGVSSLAYTTSQLRKKQLNSTQIHQAGAIYGYVGLLTVFIIGVPIILYTVFDDKNFGNAWISLLILGLILGLSFVFFWSIRVKNGLYTWLEIKFPKLINNIHEIFSANIHKGYLWMTILISIGIESCGIAHAFISMYALQTHISLEAAAVAYTISVVLMMVSPFLRGLGAVEFTMLYILTSYGYSKEEGLGITIIYRSFEFWLPLIFGVFSFIWRGRQIIARILPAIAIFLLGVINIISVATPPLAERMRLDKYYLPIEAIHASKLMVLVLGLGLMVSAAYLIKGYKSAFWIAVLFSFFSLIGHLGKALDYEEAIVSLVIILLLVTNRRQYRIKMNKNWMRIGFATFFIALGCVCLFGFISFYVIDKKHFGVAFTWQQSIYHTMQSFLLFDDELHPLTAFGREFLNITHFWGLFSWILLIYTWLCPKIIKDDDNEQNSFGKAKGLLKQYGSSPMDYFKLAEDKQLYFSKITDGFVSFRICQPFAIVLEEPVCAFDDKDELIEEFEQYCHSLGLKSIYYRVDENSLLYFNALRKRKIIIGQEALMDVASFSLEGKSRKSLRNGLNSLEKKGYTTRILLAPQRTEIVEELKKVSDEWLTVFDKKEMIFSQGQFNTLEIEQQDVIVVQDDQGKIVSFLNIIPDFTEGECTYDLIRKVEEAPSGCMDALVIKLVEYARNKRYKYINLGMVPMSGIESPDNPAEQIMKFAADKVGSFKHYQSLRDFKEKYATIWENKYLVFGNDFDLLQLPQALSKVMKPEN